MLTPCKYTLEAKALFQTSGLFRLYFCACQTRPLQLSIVTVRTSPIQICVVTANVPEYYTPFSLNQTPFQGLRNKKSLKQCFITRCSFIHLSNCWWRNEANILISTFFSWQGLYMSYHYLFVKFMSIVAKINAGGCSGLNSLAASYSVYSFNWVQETYLKKRIFWHSSGSRLAYCIGIEFFLVKYCEHMSNICCRFQVIFSPGLLQFIPNTIQSCVSSLNSRLFLLHFR